MRCGAHARSGAWRSPAVPAAGCAALSFNVVPAAAWHCRPHLLDRLQEARVIGKREEPRRQHHVVLLACSTVQQGPGQGGWGWWVARAGRERELARSTAPGPAGETGAPPWRRRHEWSDGDSLVWQTVPNCREGPLCRAARRGAAIAVPAAREGLPTLITVNEQDRRGPGSGQGRYALIRRSTPLHGPRRSDLVLGPG